MHEKHTDWLKFIGKNKEITKKEKSINYATRNGISIYIDDPKEKTSGIYSIFRQVASESEIEKRITEYKKLYWQRIAIIFTFICSITVFVKWIAEKYHLF